MAIPDNLLATLEEECFYHITCKSINEKSLFREDKNKIFFLKKYQNFLGDYIDTYAYCLLDNHVHWLIKVKQANIIHQNILLIPDEEKTILQKRFMEGKDLSVDELVVRQFNSFFVSYTRSFH
ncbi:MAG: transposase [Sphingobacteriales bacterium]|nr:transposase [Sphingobacteriales bacterium]MBI3720609.1 transposase [Sphingobacteriales bacterium]